MEENVLLNKKLMILTIVLVSLLAVSAVSAADNTTSDVASVEKTDEVISVDKAKEVISVKENQVILSENNNVGTFDDLQTEINNAPEGSVLNLTRDYNGAKNKVVLLNKNLTIDGQGHTIDCLGDDCSAFYSDAGTITLKNLKIINGHNDDNYKGGAIYIGDSAKYTIINCTFNNNWADDYGGAIYNGVNPLTIINCSFNNNKADDEYGGAVYTKGSTYVSGSSFTDNYANNYGGAIYSKNLNIINCTFLSNKADDYGGAICAYGNTSISDSSFIDNYANKQGGAIHSSGFLNITNSTFRSNKADYTFGGDGGAIYTNGSTSISGSSFIENSVLGQGGAIYSKHDLDIVNCSFTSNKAHTDGCVGGAISAKGNVVTIVGSNFTSNEAGRRGGAIFARDRTENKPVYVKIIDSSFIENCCEYDGGALCVRGNLDILNSSFKHNTVSDDAGGAIFCDSYANVDSYTTVVDSTFIYNNAIDDGGAIHSNQDMTVIRSVFENNNIIGVNSEGGAIKSTEDVKIENSTFRNNHAPVSGGAIYADTITWVESPSYFIGNSANKKGGAIYTNKFKTNVKYGVFINNKGVSDDDGGAIYINKENHLIFSQCYFENNRCGDEGGAIYLDSTSSTLILEYNIFVDNWAGDKGYIVYNKGKYNKIHNNWYGNNTFDFSNELVEYNFWGSDKNHKDDEQVLVELSLNETCQPSTLIVRFISDGKLFNYDAKFSADNGAILTNHKTGNNTVTSDITFDEGITTVTATVNHQVLKLSYSFSKENVTMDINAPEISFSDNATINIIFTPNNATGTVSVGNISSDVVDGAASIIIPNLSVGNHNLEVSYSGDGLYNHTQGNVTITVNRKNLNIDASAKPIHEGENATVIVTGLEHATGNVTVTINNNNWTAEIINGTATIIILGLSENTAADVTYLGDANYTNTSTTVDIIVNPKPKENLTINASANPIMVGEDATVIVNGLANATGNVTVIIGSNNWTGEINQGIANVIVQGLTENVTATVFYAGDYKYNNATTTVNITVKPAITVWYVNRSKESSGNGTTPDTAFKTLKEALNKAPENSTIYIAPGTYTGENNTNLTFNKNLNFINYGTGEVIFDAQGLSRIWTVTATSINITGLTFKNGKEEYVCGAIFFNQTLKDSYINAIFINNSVVDGLGGAIGFYADVINTNINSIFIENSVNNGYGGAIFFNGNLNNVNITGNYTANKANDYGGAIVFYGNLSNVNILGNFSSNKANDSGGAIFFNGNLTNVNISGSYNNNRANDTAGVFLFYRNLTNVVISGEYTNNAAQYCAVYYMSEFATINNSSISGNYYNNSADYFVVFLMEGIISNSNISGTYTNNKAKMGINIIGEAYNVNMCGNYVNNNISNGSAIYIGYCDENSIIHDSIFINNTIDDELIIDVESGSLLSVNNWFGNNASNYNIKPKVSENVAMANWLFLNATTNTASEITVNETAEITFKLYAYNSTSEEIKEYDASEMNIRLDLSQRRGTLNQTSAFINEAILYQCGEEGIASVTGKFETASYTIILAKQSTEIIINKTEIKLKVNESVSAGATLNPSEAGNLTYASSNDTVAVVENGIIKCLNEGAAIITVSFAGNDEYAPAVSKNITVYVEKRIPLIIAGADVTENIVTINVDIDGYDGLISMNLFDSVVYMPINSSLTIVQILDPGTYNINITALGNDMFYPGSEILTFTVSEPEKLNTSIAAQSSVNGYSATITVDVDLNATGFVEIDIAGGKYYAAVVNGTAVFVNDYFSGSYVAYVTYLGDENYNKNSTKLSFNIADPVKENTPISLDVEIVENTAIFAVNVDKDATGLVKFEVNGDNESVLYADVKDGQVMLSGLLEAGNYTVVATYMGDTRFNTNITYKEFRVIGHIKKDTPIAAQADVNGYKVTIAVDVDSGATGFVRLQIGDTIANVELENGTGTYVATLPVGSYLVQATYLGDENYNKNSTQTAFTISESAKQNTSIGLEIVIDENEAMFDVSVDKSASGLVKFQVFQKESGENQTFYMDVENGEAIASMVFEKGNYTIFATYMGDELFNTNITSQDFTVVGHVMKDTPITAQADVNGYKVTIAVDVDSNATGFAEIKYGDTLVYIALENGTGTYVTTLPAGSYNIDITYMGDENYNANATKLTFNVVDPVKENTPISLDVKIAENNVTFTVNVDKDATGIVKFEVFDIGTGESEAWYEDVKDGAAISANFASNGNYTVTATYLGDDRFNTNLTSQDFTVVGHIMKDTPITAQADVNGYRVTVSVNVDANATGFVKVKLGDSIFNIELTNGTGSFITNLAAGSYYADLTYLGDDNFNKNSTSLIFTVVNPVKENTPISIDVGGADNNVTFTATVSSAATGIVKFDVRGPNNYVLYVDVVDGVAFLEDILDAGNYTVIATYMGDARYNSNITSADFTVNKTEKQDTNVTIDIPVDVKVGEDVPITVDIPGATGNVSVIVDGVETVVPLDENGTAKYVIPAVEAGNHSVVVIYPGDETHTPAHTASSFKVDEEPVVVPKASEFGEITIGDDQSVSLVLKDADGNAIANAQITYTVNGKAGTTITDGDGKFTIKGEDGATLTIDYAGNETILGTNTLLKLNNHIAPVVDKIVSHFDISNRAITINGYAVDVNAGEEGIYYATRLLDVNGKPISNVYIEFAVNNKIYNRTTYENGSFKPYRLNMVRAGRYTMAFNFAGDDNYTNAFACVCVDLDKKPITIKASAKSYKASTKTKKYTVQLKTIVGSSHDGKAHLRSGLVVKLKVNGKTYSGKINSKGKVTFKITNLKKKGKYVAKISYAGDKTYESASKKVIITIK